MTEERKKELCNEFGLLYWEDILGRVQYAMLDALSDIKKQNIKIDERLSHIQDKLLTFPMPRTSTLEPF